MSFLRYQGPDGTTRPWTLKEWVQGRPINRPTHPVLVIFPIGFYVGALVLDVLSRISLPGAALTATYAVAGAVIGALLAIVAGLADRSDMRPGSRIRKVATRHMLIQFTSTAIFIVNLVVRWSGRHAAHAKPLWIVLDAIGTVSVIVGGDAGAQMVFKMGYRVGPQFGDPTAPAVRAPEGAAAAAPSPQDPPPREP